MNSFSNFNINNINYALNYDSLANKPGTEEKREIFFAERTFEPNEQSCPTNNNRVFELGDYYIVTINNIEYKCYASYPNCILPCNTQGCPFHSVYLNQEFYFSGSDRYFYRILIEYYEEPPEVITLKVEHIIHKTIDFESLPLWLQFGKPIYQSVWDGEIEIIPLDISGYNPDYYPVAFKPATWNVTSCQAWTEDWRDSKAVIFFDNERYELQQYEQCFYPLSDSLFDITEYCIGDITGQTVPFFLHTGYGVTEVWAEPGIHYLDIWLPFYKQLDWHLLPSLSDSNNYRNSLPYFLGNISRSAGLNLNYTYSDKQLMPPQFSSNDRKDILCFGYPGVDYLYNQ